MSGEPTLLRDRGVGLNVERAFALIRADGSPTLGTGHVMRTIALAESLRAKGENTLFVLSREARDFETLVSSRGFGVRVLAADTGTEADIAETTALIDQIGAAVCVIDGYRFSPGYYAALSRLTASCAIDDLNRDLPVELLIRPGFGSKSAADVAARCCLAGEKYALLRSEFSSLRTDSPTGERKGSIGRVLVTMGGQDNLRAAPRIVNAIARFAQQMGDASSISIVIGGSYRDDGELTLAVNAAKMAGFTTQILQSPPSMAALMASADCAIAAAGGTLLELACVGCPTLAFAVADNQLPGANALAKADLIHYGGLLSSLSSEQLTQELSRFFNERSKRDARALRARARVDGYGAVRVACALQAIAKERTSQLSKENRA